MHLQLHASSGLGTELLALPLSIYMSDVAHGIGVQNRFLHFFCLQEPIFDVQVIFCFKIRGVRLPC